MRNKCTCSFCTNHFQFQKIVDALKAKDPVSKKDIAFLQRIFKDWSILDEFLDIANTYEIINGDIMYKELKEKTKELLGGLGK